MKKITYLLLFSLFFIQACVQEEDDLFEQSAANRMTATLAEYEEILQDSHYGWVMDYYPGYDQDYGGYNFFVKFEKGEVRMSAEERIAGVPAGNEVTSLYSLTSDQGPVLSFDTYNAIFHHFSEPKGTSNVDGYAGDYEFVFMNVKTDTILFRGKKHSNQIQMDKLSVPPLDYLDKVLEMREYVDYTPRVKMVAGGMNISMSMENKRLYYTLINEDGDEEDYEVAFIYKPEGIRLHNPITVNNITVQNFTMDIAADRLVGVEGNVIMPYPGALEEFCTTSTQWWFNFNISNNRGEMSDEVFDVLSEINAENKRILGETISGLYMGQSLITADRGAQSFVFSSTTGSSTYTTSYRYTMTPDYSDKNRIKIKLGNAGTNWTRYYSHFLPLLRLIEENSPYDIKFDNTDDPYYADLVSVNNPDIWFTVARK